MRIRHVLPQPEMGILPLNPLDAGLPGIVNSTLQLAMQQAANGHDVEIVCPIEGRQRHQQVVAGIQIYWLPLWEKWRVPRYDWRYLLPLFLFTLRSEPVDITHVHSNPFLLVRPKSRAAVLHYRGPALKNSPIYDVWVARADAIICISDYIRREVVNTVRYPAEKVTTVYNGIYWHTFADVDRAQARARFNITNEQVVVLYAGRLVPEKGLLVLVEALRKVVQSGYHNVVLSVAGTARLGTSPNLSHTSFEQKWPALAAYERLVHERSSGLPVRFLGNISCHEMPLFYRMGDIFVCPSIYQEPFGRTNAEAMAASLPVIASAVGGIPEVVHHEQNGLLVPGEDAQALAEALMHLISDRDLRYGLGRASQDMARQFDWPVIARQVEEIYNSILG